MLFSEARNRRIRYNLKVSIKKKDEQRLPIAVSDFKKANLPDDDMDLEKAERILREWQARDGMLLILFYLVHILYSVLFIQFI